MRLAQPTVTTRQRIYQLLALAFDRESNWYLTRAIGVICKFYRLPKPRVMMYERLSRPEYAGQCTSKGLIQLIKPMAWKAHRRHNSKSQWVDTVLHELGHYVLWSDSGKVTAEKKADRFSKMVLSGVTR